MKQRGTRAGGSGKRSGRDPDPSAMGTVITEVRPDAGKPGCVTIRVRGRKAWRVDDEAAAELGVAPGMVLEARLLERIERAAKDCAARLKLRARLAVRAMSRMEAGGLLRRAGADAGYAQKVVDRFVELGWIDDEKLAESVAAHEAARAVGTNRVVSRVARRGINSGEARRAAEAAVAARRESPAELAQIAAAAQVRKLPPGLNAETKRRRVLGFLARRGFDEHTAREAVLAVLGRGGREG